MLRRTRAALAAALALGLMATGCGHGAGGAAAKSPHGERTTAPASPAKAPPATATAPAGALVLHLAPAGGPPGTAVVITGTAPAGQRPQAADTHATVCWASCSAGLKEQAVRVDWSASRPGAFAIRMRVPETPWVSAAGVHAIAAGTYAIGVQCLVSYQGCGNGPAEASASFRLTGPTSNACMNGQPCGALVLSPPGGPPGTVVHISGWAPLSQVIGQPTGFAIGLREPGATGQEVGVAQAHQHFDGDLYGSFVLPPRIPGNGALTPGAVTIAAFVHFAAEDLTRVVAQTAFQVQPPATWASLGLLRPALIQPAAPGRATASDPADPARIAACQPAGGIGLSSDGGHTWQTVLTSGIATALQGTPYTITRANHGSPVCATLLLPPGGATIFATFGAVAHGGGPPFYRLALMTANRGQSWTLLPAPAGYKPSAFSRLQLSGDAVQALFWKGPGATTTAFGLEQSSDGGRTWTPGRLACPPAGPCVAWGPAPTWTWPGACNAQSILWSADGGRTWRLPIWPTHVCYVGTGPVGPYELAAIGSGRVALLGGATYPLRLSADGGRTWQAVQVPPLPAQGSAGYPPVRLLRDGTLAAPGSNAWYALPPGAAAWCRTATPAKETLASDATLRCGG